MPFVSSDYSSIKSGEIGGIDADLNMRYLVVVGPAQDFAMAIEPSDCGSVRYIDCNGDYAPGRIETGIENSDLSRATLARNS